MFHEVLGRTFTKTSFCDCYRDAVIEMYSYLKRYGKMKEKSSYALKNGVLLHQKKTAWKAKAELIKFFIKKY